MVTLLTSGVPFPTLCYKIFVSCVYPLATSRCIKTKSVGCLANKCDWGEKNVPNCGSIMWWWCADSEIPIVLRYAKLLLGIRWHALYTEAENTQVCEDWLHTFGNHSKIFCTNKHSCGSTNDRQTSTTNTRPEWFLRFAVVILNVELPKRSALPLR